MCEVIAVGNEKGGVGKTTTTKNLGRALSKVGKKVLLIDFDPQHSLSISLGFSKDEMKGFTINELMELSIEMKSFSDIEKYIRHCEYYDVILSNILLSALEMKLVGMFEREFVLKNIIDSLKVDYDYILIDCNPSLGILVINALAACDSVIIPVASLYLDAQGLELFLMTIIRIMQRINTKIYIKGILITKSNTTNLSKDIFAEISNVYGSDLNVFSTKIPNSIRVGESDKEGLSIIDFKPKNPVSKAYMELAKEVINYAGQ